MNQLRVQHKVGDLCLHAHASFDREWVVISGENGAGKTSLLRLLAGLDAADDGQISINGNVWLDTSSNFVLNPENRHVGCVWADSSLLPWLTAMANITLGVSRQGRIEKEAWLRELVQGLEIEALMQRRPHALSSGEAQRVALARALYACPEMLLLDEPFSAQAPAIRSRLRDWLKGIRQQLQISVLMVSHDAEDARVLADQHWYMRQGHLLVEAGTAADKSRWKNMA